MRLSVAYKLALKLLIEIKLLEKDPSGDKTRIAVFAKLLSDTRLLPKHRVICARMAINKNLDVNNFGVAGRLLQSLVPLQLPDQATTESRLKKCEEEKFQDSSLPAPYICPSCNSSVSVGASLCPTCNRTPYFCALVRSPLLLISRMINFLFCQVLGDYVDQVLSRLQLLWRALSPWSAARERQVSVLLLWTSRETLHLELSCDDCSVKAKLVTRRLSVIYSMKVGGKRIQTNKNNLQFSAITTLNLQRSCSR